MDKRGKITVFVIILFLSLVSASNVGLIENSTWQSNLTGSNYHNAAVFGDIDNDNDLDLIEIGCDVGNLAVCTIADKTRVYINNGTSFEENSTWEQNLSVAGEGSLALGDINNDGRLDLILTGSYTSLTHIFINNGSSFEENMTWWVDPEKAGSDSLLMGDVNNDGLLDLIFTQENIPDHTIYLNNGSGFVNSSVWSSGIYDTEGKTSSVLGDFNTDSYLDFISMGLRYGFAYINNGTGFNRDYNWSVYSGDENSIVSGDLDNDGYLDVIEIGSGGICDDVHNIFINNGSEFILSWKMAYNQDMACLLAGSLALGDYDNNGYLDLISMGGFDQREIFSNNGTTFEEDETVEANITGERYSSALWGDVDNNGLLDLVIIRSQKVYINNGTISNKAPTPSISLSSSYNNRIIKLGWQNGSDNETPSMGLYYNLMVGTSSNNHSIISGVYGGQGDQTGGGTTGGYFGNMMQRKNFSLKVDRLEPSTTYVWYVQTIDTGLKAGNWSAMQSFTAPADMEQPNITLNAPVNALNFSSYTITFNATVFDDLNLTNVSLWGSWNGGWHLNETNSSGINSTEYVFTLDLTGEADGPYTWIIQAEDNATNVVNSTIRTFTLDTTKPNITITYPTNNTNYTTNSLNVNYSVSDNIFLANCWYSNDSFAVNTSLESCADITGITWAEGTHNVRIYVNDSVGNENVSSIKFSIDTIKPQISIIFPSNNTNTTDNNLNVNYTVSDTSLASCWYSNDTYSVNTSLASCGNLTDIVWADGKHNITIWANDSFGNVNNSRVSFMVDNSTPAISLVSPENSSLWTSSLTVNFYYNVTDVEIANCSLIINGVLNETDTSISVLTSQSFSKALDNGNYNWNVNCTDYVGYTNASEIRNLTVSYTAPSTQTPAGSGSGGGGTTATFWTKTEVVNDANFSVGVEKELSVKQRVQVVVGGEGHYIGVINVDNSSRTVTINISSNPIQITLGIGEEKRVDVSNDSWYDIYVKLISILNNKANLTIKAIHEEIPVIINNQSQNESAGEIPGGGGETKKCDYWLWIAVGIATVLIAGGIVFYLLSKKKKWKKDIEKLYERRQKLEKKRQSISRY